ncbi:MAG: hypothetical protein ACF8Q5_12465 [Phycisphaerales bacterium JB040]
MSDSSIRLMCPNLTCRKVLAVPSTARGKTVRCRNCGTNIRVPMGVKAEQNPDAAPDKSAEKKSEKKSDPTPAQAPKKAG